MYNFEYKKSLGQNFIKDENIIDKIISSVNIDTETMVIEIGPGSGMLSKKIVEKAGFALLYEIDTRLDKILNKELANFNNYKLIFEDFLKTDIKEELKQYNFNKTYIVANLPYYITTPIITKIVNAELNIDKIVIMIQKEVADRLTAKPNNREYGSLTVFLNYYYNIEKLFNVSKNSFIPKPKVDSSVILMTKKENQADIKNKNLFNQLVRDSFKYKRKNLRNNLFNYNLEVIEKVLRENNLDLNSRAENLSLEVFIKISNELK